MFRRAYPSDLSNEEWALIEHLQAIHQGIGHHRIVDLRQELNAIFWAIFW